MNLCIIPARGGSKRIPKKNIKHFHGKPIISYSIAAAIDSKVFDKVIVSTDDDEIKIVSESCGADVPFLRPNEISDDYTGTTEVIAHAVQWSINAGFKPEYVCCLHATAPFVIAEDIKMGYENLIASGADYAFAITKYNFPIQRALRLKNNGRLEMFEPANYSVRSQDLEQAWHDAGQFYWGKSSAWLDRKMIFSENACPVPLPSYRVQDIDTLDDWRRAEVLFAIK